MSYFRRRPNMEVNRFQPKGPWADPELLHEGDEYVTSTDFQRAIGECLRHIDHDRGVLVITIHRRPSIALVPIEELQRLRKVEERMTQEREEGGA